MLNNVTRWLKNVSQEEFEKGIVEVLGVELEANNAQTTRQAILKAIEDENSMKTLLH